VRQLCEAVGDMPHDQIVAKAILAGAVGGMAVAASGGGKDAVTTGFLLGAGMVIVQDGFQEMTDHELDGRVSQGEGYCMSVTWANVACAPPDIAFERDANGNYVKNPDGTLALD